MSKASEKRERTREAIERLRKLLPPGSTVYTVLRHVSKSSIMRVIDCYAIVEGEPLWLSGYVSKAVDIYPLDKKWEALKAQGCGMDMRFAIVHNLSSVLYPAGFGCIGEQKQANGYTVYCPSNDHSNGDRDYTPHANGETGEQDKEYPDIGNKHWHAEGGYALRHKWM